MSKLELPIRAAIETAARYGVAADRCEILQDANTLVLRLSETLVARVVVDLEGPRKGLEWFQREISIVNHLTKFGAPLVPVHPDLPAGPHEHLGYALNFWEFVQRIEDEPLSGEIGKTLYQCHEILRSFSEPLPELAILTESLHVLETLKDRKVFFESDWELLHRALICSLESLRSFPMQPLHGDAHSGNLMNTTRGLRWADWEDAFLGPVEWDLASIVWNSLILEKDLATVDEILNAYRAAGGSLDQQAFDHSMIARAAVMSAWYPVLYPDPSTERKLKLKLRLDWLANVMNCP